MLFELQPDLLDRCLRGERQAFRELVEGSQGYAFRLAFRMVWDEQEAREIVQDAFIRVWKHLPSFDRNARFTTWLYRIVVNLSRDSLRRRARSHDMMVPLDDAGTMGAEGVESAMVNRDLASRIRALAEGLSPAQRSVFVLRDLQDLSIEETAGILSISPGAVKANLCYARRRIRERMERAEHSERDHHDV
jgi:RNA polymerase sigma-70 factor (ECF subfamily)